MNYEINFNHESLKNKESNTDAVLPSSSFQAETTLKISNYLNNTKIIASCQQEVEKNNLLFIKGYYKARRTFDNFHGVDIQPNEQFKKNPHAYIQSLTKSETKILDAMLYGASVFTTHYQSKNSIAAIVGCSEKTVERALNKFQSSGLLARNYRHFNSNQYKISSWFRNPFNKLLISNVLKNIKMLPIALLCIAAATQSIEQNVAQHKIENKNNNYIYKPSVIERVTLTRARARDGFLKKENTFGMKHFIRKIDNPSMPVSPAVLKLKGVLPLSKWGQLKLTAFPDAAIGYARGNLKSLQSLKDPFAYFISLCLKYCKEKHIKPDFKWYDQIKAQLNIPQNPIFLLSMSDNRYYAEEKNSFKKDFSNINLQLVSKKSNTLHGQDFPYKPFVPTQLPPAENRENVQERITAYKQSEEYQKFLQLMGPELAATFLDTVIERTTF